MNSNVSALGTRANLQSANNSLAGSIKRLSTGLRINQASDDASGLAISEKMRTQIRGLDKANENAQNGISMLQTAEGALNEDHSILQRMRELSVQASNGTLTSNDRIEVQKEVDALKDEIDGISTRTEFNTKKLLTGDATGYASFSSDKIEAVFNGGKVEDGEYSLEINATAGTAQVQASSVFRFKEGVQSVDQQDLNATQASTTLAITDINTVGSAAGDEANISLTFNFGGEDISVSQNYTSVTAGATEFGQDTVGQDLANLINANADLKGSIQATYSTDSHELTIESVDAGKDQNDFTLDHSVAYTSTISGGLGAADMVNFTGGTDAETGLSGLTNLTNLAASPTESAGYVVNVDDKATGTGLTADALINLETTQGGALQADNYDVYSVIGSSFQDGSTGLQDAKLDYTIDVAAGAIDLDFNFTGNADDTISFTHTSGGAANADAVALADAINANDDLNGTIKAEADATGTGVTITALNQNEALEYRMEVKDGTGLTGGATGDSAQFLSGLGRLSADDNADGAFKTTSNSLNGGEAIIEFTSDGEIGQNGLDAKVSFDGGSSWTNVTDIWSNNGADQTATDGDYRLDFNHDFNNGGMPGTVQAGDRMLIGMNDNQAHDNADDSFTFKGGGAGGVDLSITIDETGETFTMVGTTSATALDDANALMTQINGGTGIIGSDGTNLRDIMSFSNTAGTSATVDISGEFDYTLTVGDVAASANENVDEATTYHNYRADTGDLVRVDGFDPTSGATQNGVVYSFDADALDDTTTTIGVAYMDQANGQVTKGSVDVTFDKGESDTVPADGTATFTATQNGGGDVFESTQLQDIDRFYDADGNFVLGENGETFSIYNAYGDSTEVYIDGGDTLEDVVGKIQTAITDDVAAGGLGMSTGNSDLDDNIVSFVTESTPGSTESQQGSIVVRSGKSGANGRLFFSGSEDLQTALGLSTVVDATENSLEVTVTDGLTGRPVGSDVVTDNILHGVVAGVEIEFDQGYDISTSYNEDSKTFEFSSSTGTVTESMKIVDNSTDFQIGANQGQTLNANIGRVDSHSLKVDRVQVTDQESAKDAITQIDDAIDQISGQRAKIGAWVNRLEHTMSNLDVQSENQVAAESRIRDLNIAKESTEMSKASMLTQASTSMLAQANQSSSGLLALLR